jgi:GSH-dependent disulfide-bond oxidoreductase
MIDLYFAPTANGLRASVILEETGLPYRVHAVDLAKGEQKTPAFLAVNPAGAIPAIIDPDGPGGKPLRLAQSGAIILYAAEKSDRFLPRDPAVRLAAMQWLMMAASDISGAGAALFFFGVGAPDKTPGNISFLEGRLLNYYRVVDAHLAGREFLADELSVADLALYPNYATRKAFLENAGGLANLHRWGAAIGARPGVARGMATR